jgi:hypothetical protein
LKVLFPQKLSDVSFTNPTSTVVKPLITESNAQMRNGWRNDHKSWTSDNWTWVRDVVRWVVLHAVPYTRKSLRLDNTQGSLQSGMPGSTVKHGWDSVMVWAAISWYSVGSIIALHGRITAKEYMDRLGNQVHPMIKTLFPSNDTVFQDNNAPIHTAITVLSWFEEHEGELQHLPWPAQSPDLNIIEPFWPVLETRVRNRFPLPTSLKQLEVVLHKEWHKIPL